MKAAIYYFSGTGNSLKVARDIAEKLGDTELIPIAKVKGTNLKSDAERIGIVFPVYMWGMPLIAAEFIKNFKHLGDRYYFAVTTYGGFPGGTLEQTKKIFKQQGLTLSAGFGVGMPGNYTPMYGAIAEEKQQQMFDAWKNKVDSIAGIIDRKEAHKIEKGSFISNFIFSKIIYNLGSPHIHEMDKSFSADENCNGCGTCEKVCPVGNISMQSGKPVWQKKCEQCLACLHWCPKEALQAGKKTPGRKRYRHPDMKLKDFMQ